MNEIKRAIKILARYKFRSTSNVVGEYVERLIASAANGEQAGHCQKGFDVFSKSLGKIEVKSRNDDAKSKQCTLTPLKLKELDNFILIIMKSGEIKKALLFKKDLLLKISSKSNSKNLYINENHYSLAEDITNELISGKI